MKSEHFWRSCNPNVSVSKHTDDVSTEPTATFSRSEAQGLCAEKGAMIVCIRHTIALPRRTNAENKGFGERGRNRIHKETYFQ